WKYLLSRGAKPDLVTAAMLGLVGDVAQLLNENPGVVNCRDSHGRMALDAATLIDTYRSPRTVFGEGHVRAAQMLIDRGANVELEHAAAMGLMGRVRQIAEGNPEALIGPKHLEALIGGTAVSESA